MSDVKARIIKVIASLNKDNDPTKIDDKTRLAEDLGMDSLDQVEAVMSLEEEFGIEIPETAAEKIVTIEDAVNFVEEQLKKAA